MSRCMRCMEEYSDKRKACPYCNTLSGARAVKDYHLPTNTVLVDRYIIGMALNENSISIKYICYDNLKKEKIFIYEFFPISLVTRNVDNLVISKDSFKGDKFAACIEAYVEEVKKRENISKILGLETITDYFIENNTCYVVCEYEKYITLNEYLKNNNKGLNTKRVMYRMLHTLNALQSEGIIHGNISPEHIVVKENYDIMLVDFGVGCFVNSTGIAVYSPSYSAIEAYGENAHLYFCSDVYSLSAVFYKLLSGVTPYSAIERSNGKEITSLRKLGIKINKGTENAILNALNIETDKRYRDADKFFTAIKNKNTHRMREKGVNRSTKFHILIVLTVILLFVTVIVTVILLIVVFNNVNISTNDSIEIITETTTSSIEETSATETTAAEIVTIVTTTEKMTENLKNDQYSDYNKNLNDKVSDVASSTAAVTSDNQIKLQ